MNTGIFMWVVFLAVIIAGMLISRRMKKTIVENGIETDAVVSRIIDNGTQTEIDIDVYVSYYTGDGKEVEGILSNPRSDLREGQRVHIKYHPKYTANARLMEDTEE